MRKDIIDILKLTRKLGYGCSIITNGQLLNDNLIYEIKELNLISVNISLHSLKKDNYSFLYGNKKPLLDKVIDNIKKMVDLKINVGIATTVTKYNLDETLYMLNYLKSLGISQNNIAFNVLFPCENCNDLVVTSDELEKFLKLNPYVVNNFTNAPNIIEGRSTLCQLGKSIATIDYNGDIKLCGLLDFNVGSIRKDKFNKVWKESSIVKTFSGLKESFFSECQLCNENGKCGMCIARNIIASQNPFKVDKSFCHSVKVINKYKNILSLEEKDEVKFE